MDSVKTNRAARRGDGSGVQREAGLPPLVVVLSAPRSFSSVIAAMLGQHPQMYGLPETHLFSASHTRELANFRRNQYPHGLLRILAELKFGGQTAFNIIRAKHWLMTDGDRPIDKVFAEIRRMAAPARCVEKSISTCETPESLQRLMDCCPDAHFIHLTRHPLPQGESALELVRAFMGAPATQKLFDNSTHPPTADPQFHWLNLNRNIQTALAKVPRERQRVVRGEDVLASPDHQLADICGWLGLRADAEALTAMKHPEQSPYARLGPHNAEYGGDPKFLQSPELRAFSPKPYRLEQALPWRSDKGFVPEVRALAAELGYV